ncbi:hypothetical protein [Bacillus cereus]|uniref:hypothetical protein n=1 Tax=Bacillus cereus TaxID=1396 RepID=UPI000BF75C85|nr:hypothetical protein [Bacillus cereus]PFN11497.1 hypothetical protein COJ72_31820 [Bacillus cereus]
MGVKYTSLIENVDSISPEDFNFIKEDLHVASDSWKDIREYAEDLYTRNRLVETEGSKLPE